MILILIGWGYDVIRKISKVASQLIPRASVDDSLARHEDKAIFDSVSFVQRWWFRTPFHLSISVGEFINFGSSNW